MYVKICKSCGKKNICCETPDNNTRRLNFNTLSPRRAQKQQQKAKKKCGPIVEALTCFRAATSRFIPEKDVKHKRFSSPAHINARPTNRHTHAQLAIS